MLRVFGENLRSVLGKSFSNRGSSLLVGASSGAKAMYSEWSRLCSSSLAALYFSLRLMLMACAVIWGVSFVFQKSVMDHIGVFTFMVFRGALAVVARGLVRARVWLASSCAWTSASGGTRRKTVCRYHWAATSFTNATPPPCASKYPKS